MPTPRTLPRSAWTAGAAVVHAGLVVPYLFLHRPPPGVVVISPAIVSALFGAPLLLMLTVALAFVDIRDGHEWKPMVACVVGLVASVACFVPFFGL